MNPASQLGRLAAGVPKKFSVAEIAKRTARLKTAQKKRAKTQRALRRANAEFRNAASGAPGLDGGVQ
jgi:hypothetical protein